MKTTSPNVGFTRSGVLSTTDHRRSDCNQIGPANKKRGVLDRFRRTGMSALQGRSLSQKRILLVDDEAGFTNVLKISLSGFEVCVENNPLQAIETARRFRPDLIFLDVVMPDTDGGTIAAQFKEDLDLGRIPIVFLTAIISGNEAASRHQICGYEFIAKPARLEQIVDCIVRHLGP